MAQTHLIIDEFTFVGNRFFELANPTRAVGGRKLICTGTGGYADRTLWSWKLWFQAENVAKMKVRTIENPMITQDFLDDQRALFDIDTYNSLYEGEWIDVADKWFSWKLVNNSTGDYDANATQPEKGAYYIIGVDPSYSGTGDYACISVCKRYFVQRDGMKFPAYRVVYMKRFKPDTLVELMRELNYVIQCYSGQIDMLVCDASDFRFLEALQQVNIFVKPYEFSGEGRNNLMKMVKALMEQERLQIPSDMDLVREFCSLSYRISGHGNLLIQTPSGGHDDQVVSIGLAILADEQRFFEDGKNKEIPIFFPLPFGKISHAARMASSDPNLTSLHNWGVLRRKKKRIGTTPLPR
jgi:hypothetical protein